MPSLTIIITFLSTVKRIETGLYIGGEKKLFFFFFFSLQWGKKELCEMAVFF